MDTFQSLNFGFGPLVTSDIDILVIGEQLENDWSKCFRFQKSCIQCLATSTPQWREGPSGKRSLCNACGVVHLKMKKNIVN